MEMGKRIIYNKLNGRVLNSELDERIDSGLTEEMFNNMRPIEIDFIDLPYGDTTLYEVEQYHIDIETKTIIIDSRMPHVQTEAERIAELENIILESEGLI